MRILINLSTDEINTLGQITEIRDENDVIFCLHELIEKATAKMPENIQDKYHPKYGEIRAGRCPACGDLVSDMLGLCSCCGQRMQWRMKKDEEE